MLAVAAEHSAAIAWHEGVAEALPFPAAAFDAVTCQFGLMFFRDRARAVAEMRRVLRPGGRLAFAVWASLDRIPTFAAEVALFDRVCGSAAAEALRAPFGLGERAALVPLLPGAAVTTHTTTARFPSVRTLVEADLRGWLPIMGVHLGEPVIAEALNAADDALAPHVTREASGAVVFPTSAHVVRWTKPV